MIIGYSQQLNADDSLYKLKQSLKYEGCEKVFIDVYENISSKPELNNLLDFLRQGDTIKIYRIEDLGTTARYIIMSLRTLIDYGIDVDFVNTSAIGYLSYELTEFVRTLSDIEKQRKAKLQAEGIAKAKKEGRYKGRPKKEYDYNLFVKLYKQWKEGEIKQSYMMKQLNISRATLDRRIREYEGKQLSKEQ